MKNTLGTLFLAAFVLSAATDSISQTAKPVSLTLAQPIDCELGSDCFLQNYVDVDPGPDAKDFQCLALTYDGHKGTDFRLPNLKAMRDGVAVLAAAKGTVKALRDGEEDGVFWNGDRNAVSDKECGNGIVLDHGNGWETQYCHLKAGSITVRQGQLMTTGQPMAQVGLSGRTEFPHLHIAVRYNGTPIDPFTGNDMDNGCGHTSNSLWSNNTLQPITYAPVGLINDGFADGQVTMRGIEENLYQDQQLSTTSPGLVYYARVFGLRPGDTQKYTVVKPDGSILAQSVSVHEGAPKAQYFRFVGKRIPQNGWPPGKYEGRYTLSRDGKVIIDVNKRISLK